MDKALGTQERKSSLCIRRRGKGRLKEEKKSIQKNIQNAITVL